jgi:hypothetical protein
MSIQQAEGWHLWAKSRSMRRQALRRTTVSVPRRARLAGILVVLLTGTGLLDTSAFGDIGLSEEAKQCAQYLRDNGWPVPANCCKFFVTCQNAPVPVSCPDEYPVATPTGDCLPRAKADCNSEKFRGCLAKAAEGDKVLRQLCQSHKLGEEYLLDMFLNVAEGVDGGFNRLALYQFLVSAALDTIEFRIDLPEWERDLDSCLDAIDELKLSRDDNCARESGCWPHR